MEMNLLRVWFEKLLDALRFKKTRSVREAADLPADRMTEPFTVVSDGIKIRGSVLFPVARPARQYPAVILCHGIPGSGAPRPEGDPGYEGLAQELASLGIASVVFNFRGCGESDGDFDMAGWSRDLDVVLDRILNTPHIDPTRVILIGFSGGGAAAIHTAADQSGIYGLAVVGTPASFEIFKKEPAEIVKDFRERGIIRDPQFPTNVERWIDGFKEIEPEKWIAYFKGKYILIVHGDADELIPVEHAREIFRRAPAGIAELSIIPGGVHRLRLDPRCTEVIESWLTRILD